MATLHESAADKTIRLIEQAGGVIRTSVALRAGVHPRVLYRLRDSGVLERVSRGVYRLAAQQPLTDVDLVTVAARIPRAVVCLVSALAFHDITTQIPHAVSIALERGAEPPRLDHPPVSVHRFSGASLTAGVEVHLMDGVTVRVYSREKTLADCFKFRHRLGMDIVLEALKLYAEQEGLHAARLLQYARICRVERTMRPYIEALL